MVLDTLFLLLLILFSGEKKVKKISVDPVTTKISNLVL